MLPPMVPEPPSEVTVAARLTVPAQSGAGPSVTTGTVRLEMEKVTTIWRSLIPFAVLQVESTQSLAPPNGPAIVWSTSVIVAACATDVSRKRPPTTADMTTAHREESTIRRAISSILPRGGPTNPVGRPFGTSSYPVDNKLKLSETVFLAKTVIMAGKGHGAGSHVRVAGVATRGARSRPGPACDPLRWPRPTGPDVYEQPLVVPQEPQTKQE